MHLFYEAEMSVIVEILKIVMNDVIYCRQFAIGYMECMHEEDF